MVTAIFQMNASVKKESILKGPSDPLYKMQRTPEYLVNHTSEFRYVYTRISLYTQWVPL